MFTTLWRNKYFRYFIIISLLLHVVIYFLFFNVSFRAHSKRVIQGVWDSIALSPADRLNRIKKRQALFEKLQEIKKERQKNLPLLKDKDNGLPAKLRAKKSDFGWVLFEDVPVSPKKRPVEVPTTESGEVAEASTLHATELVPVAPKKDEAVVKPVVVKPAVSQPAVEKPVVVQQATQQPAVVQPKVVQPAVAQPKAVKASGVRAPNVTGAGKQQGKQGDQSKQRSQQVIHDEPQESDVVTKERATVEPPVEKEVNEVIPREQVTITLPEAEEQKTVHSEHKSVHKSERKLKKELLARHEESPIASLMDELNESAYDEQPAQYTQVEEQEDIFATPAQLSPDIQARIDRIARRQEQLDNYSPSVATSKVRGAKSMKNKDKRGIIALTKGFVENISGDGEDLLDRDGDPNKRPSFEDMKYMSYEANINWALQASWKQNFAYSQTTCIPEGKAVVEFTIDEKGYIIRSELLQSSGFPALDRLIMKNTSLSSPFPPLPKHFGVKNYTTGRIIHVSCNKRWD